MVKINKIEYTNQYSYKIVFLGKHHTKRKFLPKYIIISSK